MKAPKRTAAKIRNAADMLFEVLDALIHDSSANDELINYISEAAENAKAAADMIEEVG